MLWLSFKLADQCLGHSREHAWSTVELKRNNAPIVRWWVGDDVGEITVQREQKGTDLLGVGDNDWIRRVARNLVAKSNDGVSGCLQRARSRLRDAMIRKQTHQATS